MAAEMISKVREECNIKEGLDGKRLTEKIRDPELERAEKNTGYLGPEDM